MRYENTIRGTFIDRPNRFIAHVLINGVCETVHVKNTGRCRELLIPGAEVVLQVSDNPDRKTRFDLISVYKKNFGWVNIDSQAPNKVAAEWLAKQDYTYIKPEYRFKNSRFDFYMEKGEEKYLLEVKGCTLEVDGIGYFPDAASARAVRHVQELEEALNEGYRCAVAFVIAMNGVTKVLPNMERDPDFGNALLTARDRGVEIWELACRVTENSLEII